MSKTVVALVTGGMGGIGSAITLKLAQQGYRVVATYSPSRDPLQAAQWTEQFREQGLDVHAAPVDVTSLESCQSCIEMVESDFGDIGVLINNAGITKDGRLAKMSSDNWQAVIDTNLNSVFNMTQPLINRMVERQSGRVINISSINGQKGQFGQTNYSAAKAGMHGFTMALAQEVAAKGITVNTISPGYIATEMVMAVPEKIREQIIAGIPVGRLGKPEEIAETIAWLCNDNAGFVTGSNIAINGGQHMQ
ncbi:acetoacetyl-CoA reductase [Pelagibaculum spongiae]|uniref:Acetoacetyl-CoA reductase n=1 Tax=Pelagibaculum spongiae TaxID=2080658 RepID=A0A2V1GTZ4_9GAMM|nr:acetoacetyl-CoA reductase [Pelagibaculum spongiae]PVZ69556.1 acetoacetyl-CoA reductase [Pelagibaculum spongiae]